MGSKVMVIGAGYHTSFNDVSRDHKVQQYEKMRKFRIFLRS